MFRSVAFAIHRSSATLARVKSIYQPPAIPPAFPGLCDRLGRSLELHDAKVQGWEKSAWPGELVTR